MADEKINKNAKVFEVMIGIKDCLEANTLLESLGFKNPYDNHGVIDKSVIYLVEVEKKMYRTMQGIEIVFDYHGCPRVKIKELREWVKERTTKRT